MAVTRPPVAATALLVAPSGPVRPDALAAGLEVLAAWGVRVALASASAAPTSPPDQRAPGYLAGPDAARAAQLIAAVDDAAATGGVVWTVRGGYGAARTLAAAPGLFTTHRAAPLWAFSDGTALLAAWDGAGWPAWLAPPVSQLPRLDQASAARVRAAWHEDRVDPFEGLRPLRAGQAAGPLGGGNLCLLASLVGTPWAPDLRGRVLVLEDVGEAPYKVDRMFTQLRLAGALAGVVGLVLGDFTGVSPAQAAEIEGFFARQAAALGVPAAAGLPVGHGVRNAPLPMGPASRYVASLEVPAGSVGPAGGAAVGRARLTVERTP